MEDWKVPQVYGEPEVMYTKPPSLEQVTGPTDQQEQEENKDTNVHLSEPVEQYDKKFNLGIPTHPHPRLSIEDIGGEDGDEQDLVLRNAKEKAHTLMEKECAAESVIKVWEEISKLIIFKMMEGQAVRIAGLGTFTHRVHKVPVNHKVVKVTKAPSFIISEHVAQMYRLKQDKAITSNVQVVPLNLSVIAHDMKLPRGTVEGIVTEVLQAFARAIVCNKSLEFPFPFIGKLQIRDQKVSMKFYDEFCNKLGFNVSQTADAESLYDNLIQGRMTPLRHHIPTDTYRSVFHLREVRSVHQQALMIPLVHAGEKFLPVTIACEERKFQERNKFMMRNIELKTPNAKLPVTTCPKSEIDKSNNPCGLKKEKNMPETNLKSKTLKSTARKFWKPHPLYKPQKTGDCVLDLMNKCPEIMTQCIRAHMYKVFVTTLGESVVKSHFHRRGNHGPCRPFSYTELHPKCNKYDSDADLAMILKQSVMDNNPKPC